MKKGLIIGVIVLVLVAGGIWLFVIRNVGDVYKEENLPAQQCTNQGSYCIYDNIPSYLKYSELYDFYEDEEGVTKVMYGDAIVDQIKQFDGDLSEYLVINYVNGESNYKCVSTGKDAEVIEYFYDLCEGQDGMVGCGHERRAIICGDVYFVEDFTSTYGPRFYGPFEI